jgi:hypothetical protein
VRSDGRIRPRKKIETVGPPPTAKTVDAKTARQLSLRHGALVAPADNRSVGVVRLS